MNKVVPVNFPRGQRSSDARVDEITALFLEAEVELKKAEHQCRKLHIPSVNELRYVGNHLLNALNAKNPDDANYHYQEAKSHCCRAIFDAVEIRVLDYLNRIETTEQDYKSIEIGPRVQNYAVLRGQYLATKKTLASLESHGRESRIEYLAACKEHLVNLENYCNALEVAQPDLQKALSGARISVIAGIGIPVAVLAVAIIGAIFAITGPAYTSFWTKAASVQTQAPAPDQPAKAAQPK